MFKIRKKDKVMVRTGKDKGKMGEVLMVFPDKGRVIVSKANMVKKHQRPTQDSPGGIVEKECPVSISNVSLLCPRCDKPARVGFRFLEDGKKVRFCKKCQEIIE
ncbi:MAG TPA: 50S ribosomal protein L24 [bacterium]|nr:50S ribosomal protein L24 [bacterium]